MGRTLPTRGMSSLSVCTAKACPYTIAHMPSFPPRVKSRVNCIQTPGLRVGYLWAVTKASPPGIGTSQRSREHHDHTLMVRIRNVTRPHRNGIGHNNLQTLMRLVGSAHTTQHECELLASLFGHVCCRDICFEARSLWLQCFQPGRGQVKTTV